jgi:hypothetical protein
VRVNLTEGDNPERLKAFRCTPGLLQALGVKPALGRLFTTADEQDGDSRLVVLSDQLWKRRFAADPELVGTTILLNSEPYSVVDVLPPEFRFPTWIRFDDADLYPLLVVPKNEASRVPGRPTEPDLTRPGSRFPGAGRAAGLGGPGAQGGSGRPGADPAE